MIYLLTAILFFMTCLYIGKLFQGVHRLPEKAPPSRYAVENKYKNKTPKEHEKIFRRLMCEYNANRFCNTMKK